MEFSMANSRRRFSGREKRAILREPLIDKVPVSEVGDKHGVPPTMFYAWQKKLFEEGALVFEQARGTSRAAGEGRKIESLEAKIQQKNEVLAELMGEHVALKKTLGQL